MGTVQNYLFPEFWEPFAAIIPEEEQHDMISAYYRRLTSPDKSVVKQAALAWSGWEVSVSKLHHDAIAVEAYLESPAGISMARLECHYMKNKFF